MPRRAGMLLPLFSAASTVSWGLGELADIAPLAGWMAAAGFNRLMLLPLATMAAEQSSPYSAASAMAIDPLYIAVDSLDDFAQAGGVRALSGDGRRALADARSSPRVQYGAVRAAKREALDLAFARFLDDEWSELTLRAAALAGYIARERWWLDDYALFQALTRREPIATWRAWPAPIRDRDPGALDDLRRQLAHEVLQHQYEQWIAEAQWQEARARAAAAGVAVVGDLPFMVDGHSADVWSRPAEFDLEVSVGTPPDAFSATGQDWSLPACRWEVMRASDYAWIRQRARRMASLYDGFRIDHLVGFYRTYIRPPASEPFFSPADEPAQTAQGETMLGIFLESGAAIIAEDLGTVPDFVRASLARLGVPGCKVLRWERAWHDEGQPFLDPADYPPLSVALTGTHDTETLAGWWEAASSDERTRLLALPPLAARDLGGPAAPWSEALRDALLDLVFGAGSDDLFLPVQDVFGWRDRINVPATVGDLNWTWRLPWPVDRWREAPEAVERAAWCRSLARRTGRGGID